MTSKLTRVFTGVAAALVATSAFAFGGGGGLNFKDPKGDDYGPGNYIYPTDAVYKKGSFDLTGLKVKTKKDNVTFEVSVDSKLEDPWGMGSGFAIQMAFIFIDVDGKAGSGYTDSLPGLNVGFAEDSAWDKVVILSPQKQARVLSEITIKAPDKKGVILVPGKTQGIGKKIKGSVSLEEIGEGNPKDWGYQVVLQSNEGFPAKTDLLTRKVNEFEGQHRFGGGNDFDCDPHAIDILGDDQKEQLAYECDDEGNSVKQATLHMIRK
ncbi:MAG: hypothetical protein CMF25_06245 [Kangiellaceae bacterium]|nr:hypothetical protein [Kangiellaceae bacterium]